MQKEREFREGDIVRHFKRELEDPKSKKYLYRIVSVATHSETREKYIVYKALYDDGGVYVRPYDMFMSEVDHEKYPDIRQKYRFEAVDGNYMPDVEKTIASLKANRFDVSYFAAAEEAAAYIDGEINGEVVGFGDSMTMIKMKLFDRLSSHNEVHDPKQSRCEDEFQQLAREALTTYVYLTSVNAMSETGEMVNIDGTGNRVAGSLYGHRRVYFVVGVNKIAPDLESAICRARNVAGPLNARKYDLPTPCVKGEMRCYDCTSQSRICNAEVIYRKKMNHMDKAEVILIGEELGF
mgnify:CR=1 FL=1